MMPRVISSPTENAFLQAILADPEDDEPRLIFADWLEERGHPRGTFIRLQCARARLTRHDEEWKSLLAQEATLLKQHEAEWTVPIRSLTQSWEFRRGFVEHVRLPARQFVKSGERLFRQAPIRGVQIRNPSGPELIQIAECPHLGRVRWLDLGSEGVTPGGQGLHRLSRSPFVKSLRGLVLDGWLLGPSGADAIAGAVNFAELTRLCLASSAIGAAGGDALAGSEHLAKLREIKLAGNAVGPDGAAALAAGRFFRLTHLNLARNDLGNRGAAALADSTALAELRELDLSTNAISNLGVEAIARSSHLGQLESLDLENNRIGDRGIQALAHCTTFPNLVKLNVLGNEFSRAAAAVLKGSPSFPKLRSLRI